MDVSAAMASSATSASDQGANSGNKIETLRRRLQQLTKQIQEVSGSDMEPKLKQKMVKQLQDAIKLVQQQIADTVRQQQQEQQAKAAQKAVQSPQAQSTHTQASSRTQRKAMPGNPGGILDTSA